MGLGAPKEDLKKNKSVPSLKINVLKKRMQVLAYPVSLSGTNNVVGPEC